MVYIPPTLPTAVIPRALPKTPRPGCMNLYETLNAELNKVLGFEGGEYDSISSSDFPRLIKRERPHPEVPEEVTLPVILMPGSMTNTIASYGMAKFVLVSRKFGSSDQWAPPPSKEIRNDFLFAVIGWMSDLKLRCHLILGDCPDLEDDGLYLIPLGTDYLALLTEFREVIANFKFEGLEFNTFLKNANVEEDQLSFLKINLGCYDIFMYLNYLYKPRDISWHKSQATEVTNADESRRNKNEEIRPHGPSHYLVCRDLYLAR